jgi:hypothetical protein
MYAFNPK